MAVHARESNADSMRACGMGCTLAMQPSMQTLKDHHYVLCALAGVEDDGFVRGLDARELEASLRVLRGMARSLHASATVLEQLHAEGGRRGALVRVTCNAEEDAGYVDLRIAGGAGGRRVLGGLGAYERSCSRSGKRRGGGGL